MLGVLCSHPGRAGTVLVASDLHFDPMATPSLVDALSGAAASDWPDILARDAGAPSPYGSDSNWASISQALAGFKATVPTPDLVILPGDFLAHDYRQRFDRSASDHSNAAYEHFVQRTIQFLGLVLRRTFPKAPILTTLGNNDDDCGDYTSVPDDPFLTGTAGLVGDLAHGDETVAADWRDHGGYGLPYPGIPTRRIIVLNTVVFSAHYQAGCGRASKDAASGTLSWLETELSRAQKAHQQVWLVYHIPPGIDGYSTDRQRSKNNDPCVDSIRGFWNSDAESAFESLMTMYADTIALSLTGHTHMDEFRLPASGGVVLGTPGISPMFGQNPGFRTLSVASDGTIEDTSLYDMAPGATDGWHLEYDFDQVWGVPRPDHAGFQTVLDHIRQSSEDRSRWMRFYSVSHADRSGALTEKNSAAYLCAIDHWSASTYSSCYCSGGTP